MPFDTENASAGNNIARELTSNVYIQEIRDIFQNPPYKSVS